MSFAIPNRRGSERAIQPRSASFHSSLSSSAFSIGRLRFSSLGLYGRENELHQLQEAYEHVKANSGKRVVMLSGHTGAGKSVIVKKFQDGVRRENRKDRSSFFAAGKFDLHHRSEPYTALIAAFTQLGDEIMSLKKDNPDGFVQIRDSILEAVGTEGRVLRNVMPNIMEILGNEAGDSSDSDGEYDGSTEKNRFNFALRRFVHAVCKTNPIVLFLDDLQWVDAASLDAMSILMTDSALAGLLLIGCFRENEVDQSHPLAIWMRDVNTGVDEDVCISNVPIENLGVGAVHEFVTDVLNISEKSRTETLATIIHRKTLGNAFFVVQFLTSLQDEGLLVYSFATQEWRWDDEVVRCNTQVSKNVVDVLQTKMREHVARPVWKTLQLASCLGATFNKSILDILAESLMWNDKGLWSDSVVQTQYEDPAPTVDDCLRTCIAEGFLDSSEETQATFMFAHDQIQSAAYLLIPDDKKNLVQLSIGEVLVDRLSEKELESMLFIVVDLLNNGLELVTTDAKRVSIARLNLQAGKKSLVSSAFVSSTSYLTAGLRLLGASRWEENFALTLELTNTAMKAEYCQGNFEHVYHYVDEVMNQPDMSIQEKLSAYSSLIKCLGDEGRPGDALDVCINILAQLGVHFSLPLGKASILSAYWKTKQLLKKHPLDEFRDWPVLQDNDKLTAMRLMLAGGLYAVSAQSSYYLLIVFKMIRWSLRFGVCQYSPPAFMGLGVMTIIASGDLRQAQEFGNFALSMSDRLGAKNTKAFTISAYNICVSHWVTPLQVTRKELLNGYQLALQNGDIDHAMMNVCQFCNACHAGGEPLSRLEADLRLFTRQMKEYDQMSSYYLNVVVWQTVLNLMCRSQDPVVLSGAAMDQRSLQKTCVESKMPMITDGMRAYQLQLAFLFGRYDLASKLVKDTSNIAKTLPGWSLVWRSALFEGLTGFSLARQGRRWKWRRFALNVLKKVRQWVSKGNVNCLHTLHLLEAEKLALGLKKDDAKKKYDMSIAIAGKAGFLVDKAISYERAGEFFVEVRDMHLAGRYLSLAYQCYVEWEAWAKADHLYQKHCSLLSEVVRRPLPEQLESKSGGSGLFVPEAHHLASRS